MYIKMGRGITTVARTSIYKGSASRNAGRQFDRDVVAYAATGKLPANDFASRFVNYLQNKMKLSKLVTQVRVSSANKRWSTAIDAVALGGEERCPRIIETKTTRLPVSKFILLYEKKDGKFPMQMSIHSGKREINSPMRRFTDQLYNGMNMYAFRYSMEKNSMMFGSLVIVCPDGIIEYDHDFTYVPNAYINRPMPAKRHCVKARRASIQDSKTLRPLRVQVQKAVVAV
jgi:hypothetical protein